jgi:hypothetical protein
MIKYATGLRLGTAETEAILKRFTQGRRKKSQEETLFMVPATCMLGFTGCASALHLVAIVRFSNSSRQIL